jgi:hypothetical protein
VGQCGKKHYTPVRGKPAPHPRSPLRRCRAELQRRPGATPEFGALFVAPADPSVPLDDAWLVPPAELAAWCASCLDGARARARSAARQAARTAETVDPPGPASAAGELPADEYGALFDAAPFRDLSAANRRRRGGRVMS